MQTPASTVAESRRMGGSRAESMQKRAFVAAAILRHSDRMPHGFNG
jgi:hypothetical protein